MAITDPQLARVLSDLVSVLGGTTSSLAGFNRQIQQSGQAASAAARQMSASSAISQQLEIINEKFSEAGRRTGRLSDDFDRLRQATTLLEQGTDRTSKLMQINSLQMKASFVTFKEFLSDTVWKQGIESVKSLIRNIQIGTDPIAIANSINQAVVSLTAGLVSGIGDLFKNIASGVGSATTVLTKALGPTAGKIAGVAGNLATNLIGATGSLLKGAADVANFTVEILGKELEKTVASFTQITASGAIFADGMTGMRNAAGTAGMTLKDFVSVVQKNSTSLADVGFGVTGGARRMSESIKAGGDGLRLRLLNLGFNIEEQGTLVAETMQIMRGSAGILTADGPEIAKQTERYAENLRVVAAITGEDAKRRKEQVRQETANLAFQGKLANMSASQRIEVEMAMQSMTELQRKNFQDMVIFGTVINKEGAAAEAMVDGLAQTTTSFFDRFNTGTLSPEFVRQANADAGDKIRSSALQLSDSVGAAAYAGVGGIVQSLSNLLSKEVSERLRMSPEAIAAAQSGVTGLKTTTDELTTSASSIQNSINKLQVQFEQVLTPAVSKYSALTALVTEKMAEVADDLEKMIRKLFAARTGVQEDMPTVSPEAVAARARQHLVEGKVNLESMSEHQRAEAIASAESRAKMELEQTEINRRRLQRQQDNIYRIQREQRTIEEDDLGDGMARGGISVGPKSGYRRILHGIEAVVPLPDGRKIPVDVKDTTPDQAIGNKDLTTLIEVVQEQTSKFDDLISANAEMLRVLQQSRDITRDLRDNYA